MAEMAVILSGLATSNEGSLKKKYDLSNEGDAYGLLYTASPLRT